MDVRRKNKILLFKPSYKNLKLDELVVEEIREEKDTVNWDDI
jgi:hypothetical protein